MFSNKYANIETKSYRSTSNGFYTYYDNITGSFIGEPHRISFAEEIRRSVPINTVISNQLGVISSAELQMLKKDDKGTDKPTEYKPALDFLEILKKPNSSPAPKHWNHIVEAIYKAYLIHGISALVLKGAKQKTIKNIEVASSVSYQNNGVFETYNITTKKGNFRQQLMFQAEDIEGTTFFTNGDDIAIIFGNYNNETSCYETPLMPYKEAIEWNNHIQVSSNSFYKNSCRPSSIITVEFLNNNKGEIHDKKAEDNMAKIMGEIKAQLKGDHNTGKVILPSQPNLKITVTPLSITQNAVDIDKQLMITREMIYSSFSGANINVIEGKSEYANNKEIALVEYYDATVSIFTNIILDELNAFLPKWLAYIGRSLEAKERQGIYLNFDISNIKIYKREKIEQAIRLLKETVIKKEETRTQVRKYDDNYADLEILSPEEDGFINTKPSNNP